MEKLTPGELLDLEEFKDSNKASLRLLRGGATKLKYLQYDSSKFQSLKDAHLAASIAYELAYLTEEFLSSVSLCDSSYPVSSYKDDLRNLYIALYFFLNVTIRHEEYCEELALIINRMFRITNKLIFLI